MKKIRLIISLFACQLFAFTVFAQEGIQFQNASFAELKQLAATQHKLIFIDCYTSWCAPCKWMDHNVFVLPKVAEQYNSTFINARFDMEKGEGVELRKQYNVTSFPTYLFLDANGKLMYRSGSRMTAEEFMTVGENANDPGKSVASMQQQYDGGKRDMQFLLDFYTLLQHNDRDRAFKMGAEIMQQFPENEMASLTGWKALRMLSHSETDRLGAYFMSHQSAFRPFARQGELDTMTNRLVSSTLYGYMNEQKDDLFWKRLDFFRKSPQPARKKEAVSMELEFYLTRKQYDKYIKMANVAMKGLLKDDAEQLSFMARRANYKAEGETRVLEVAYAMAKRAVEMQPKEYSTLSTLAQLCLSLKKKEEGLALAKRAYEVAETTKIEKIVQQLIDKLTAL
ncbi:thioredoxin-like protein [Chitinophaga dinghuensis]|uniref:Thioredoxin-like protein n=1 Tax=Chitinophaga dinghuensis TaxID=1539050 RepID=A0A327VHV9_9BACT|nr:thioredoxin family protein [Chitinophaga dinghuensis]RAJ73464.1 thioredoxin-like protein [Chitinophaga dinghuensis]